MKLSELQKKKRLDRREVPTIGKNWECPECGLNQFEVSYTRQEEKGIYRKRTCACGAVFETFEKITRVHK